MNQCREPIITCNTCGRMDCGEFGGCGSKPSVTVHRCQPGNAEPRISAVRDSTDGVEQKNERNTAFRSP